MGPRVRTTILASLLLSAAGCLPARALAQPEDADRDETSLAVWTLLGLDLDVTERRRGVVRVGYLAHVDGRLIHGDLIFTAAPALQVVAGYVGVQPTRTTQPGSR